MAKRPVPQYDFKAFGAAIKAARTGCKESRKKVCDEMRPFQKDGTFLEKKCWREYDLDKNGQKIPTKKGNDYKSHKVYATDWDDRGNVEKWRALWADIETDFYKKNGYEITAEHRSFERQGIDLLPTIEIRT